MIHRELEVKIREYAEFFPLIAITGPRQSGKTTLAKHCFPEKTYVSLEDPDVLALANSDPRGLLTQFESQGAILDEIQKVPHLFSYLQTQSDAHPKPGHFVLTGSQNFLLHQEITQSLAGRVGMLTLHPLSFKELREHEPLGHWPSHVFKGFYPAVNAHANAPVQAWYKSYVQTYLERDVRDMRSISDLSQFQRFLKACAGRVGQLVNLSAIGNELDLSHNTIKSWISLLEASYLIFLLKPYHKNWSKRIVKMPKLYFYDTGLACHLLGINSPDEIWTHPSQGALFENAVIANHFKNQCNRGQEESAFFWRDHSGNEIDLLLEKSQTLEITEIKSSLTLPSSPPKNLATFQKITSEKLPASVIYGGDLSLKNQGVLYQSWKEL